MKKLLITYQISPINIILIVLFRVIGYRVNYFKIKKNQGVKMLFPKYRNQNSNDLEKIYHDAGQFYFGNKESFLSDRKMFEKKSFPIVIKKNHSWDIDDIDDWKIAENLFKSL